MPLALTMYIMRKRILKTSTILYTLLITILSIVNLSGRVDPVSVAHFDKLVHFCFYFGLNMLLQLLLLTYYRRGVLFKHKLIATCAVVSYSVCIEVVQYYVGRSFDLLDILANTMGTFSALAMFRLPIVNMIILRHLNNPSN